MNCWGRLKAAMREPAPPPFVVERIIDGKKYSTATATALLSYTESYYDYDGYQYDETARLYRKTTGEFFLVKRDSAWGSHYNITPLSEVGAKNWVSTHKSVTEYEQLFGPAEE